MAANNSTSATCATSRSISVNPGFIFLLSLQVILGFASFLPNLAFLVAVCRTSLFHANLRLLWAYLSVLLLVFGVSVGVKASTVLYRITWADSDDCPLMTSLYDCRLRDLIVVIPNSIVSYASVAISFERLYSTLRYRHYNAGHNPKPWLAVVAIAAFTPFIFAMQLRSLQLVSRNAYMPICQSVLAVAPGVITWQLAMNMSLEFASVLITVFIDFYNKRLRQWSAINRAQQSLAARFQIDQNVKVNKMVTPVALLQAACYIPNLAMLLMISEGISVDYETSVIWIEIGYAWKLAYSLAHPVFGIARVECIRKKVIDLIPRSILPSRFKSNTSVGPSMGIGSVHFDVLNRMWLAPVHMTTPTGKSPKG